MHCNKRRPSAWPIAKSEPGELSANRSAARNWTSNTLKRSRAASENSFPTAPKRENNRLPSMHAENTAAASVAQRPQRALTKKQCASPSLRTFAIAKQTTISCWAKVGSDTKPALTSAAALNKSPRAGNNCLPFAWALGSFVSDSLLLPLCVNYHPGHDIKKILSSGCCNPRQKSADQ